MPESRKAKLTRRAVLAGAVTVGLAAAGGVAYAFRRDLTVAKRAVAGQSHILAIPDGQLEYAEAGSGRPVLILHGTGGGFDQGLLIGRRLSAGGCRVIAPSRFGYLRSDLPADSSPEHQADLLVRLLDHLGIDRLPVGGASAGAVSAAAFALRHPDRCSALLLLAPAVNISQRDPVVLSPLQKALMDHLLRSDFLFWCGVRYAPDAMTGAFLATDPALLKRAARSERQRAKTMLEGLLPVSAKRRGLLNDAVRAGAPTTIDFSRIAAPALIVAAEDDRFGTAGTARALKSVMPDARLILYPDGGHIWLGRDEEAGQAMLRFLADTPET